jgi:hypothetical protein
VNEHDIINSATQAVEWLFDRRERLENHDEEPLTLLLLSVREVDTLEAVHGLTVDERVLRDDLVDWIGGSGVGQGE